MFCKMSFDLSLCRFKEGCNKKTKPISKPQSQTENELKLIKIA